jgi:acyl-CoA thioester hydrolase
VVTFTHLHRVSYGDCTVGNHVYYGNFVHMLETARGEFFRRLGLPFLLLQEQDFIFPVIECRLLYKAPARYDDLLSIEVRIESAEGARLEFAYAVRNQQAALILQARTSHACTNVAGKPKRLPPALLEKLTEETVG